MDTGYEAEYLRTQAARAKRRKRILLSLLAALLLFLLVYLVFFVRRPLTYADLALEMRLEDGVYYAYADWTTFGGAHTGAVGETPLRLDFAQALDYRSYHFTLYASRWERLVHGGIARLYWPKVYPDGKPFDAETQYTHVDPEGIRHTMTQRYGQILYLDPDGSETVIWTCEGMAQ